MKDLGLHRQNEASFKFFPKATFPVWSDFELKIRDLQSLKHSLSPIFAVFFLTLNSLVMQKYFNLSEVKLLSDATVKMLLYAEKKIAFIN